ncbi:MAG: hypothetical protein OFPI_09240 [Osedax symbiont Rs2]|nr:MAG: hypothetical protein OFPI_09240 [Osedax symbiont Rs2]
MRIYVHRATITCLIWSYMCSDRHNAGAIVYPQRKLLNAQNQFAVMLPSGNGM